MFGLLIGCFSFWMGKTDFVAGVNFPGSEISEIVYNDYLLPYWRNTLEPVGYEEVPIIKLPSVVPPESLESGEKVGVEIVPIYDFPFKKVSDLYIPITLLFWGLFGLMIQLIYNTMKRHRGLPR